MTDHDLDRAYTALSNALAQVGEDKAALFLATFSLALLARQSDAEAVLPLIAQAERLALV
ncbi:hypothetical protein D3870_05255 [Noviherbaspirillum cavernae]|uniref:DUF2783 domain-containing protein n=1 Tax=Noviherbaspirillum cavernae TaxID=2320862 RepID=A0A418WZ36_9BURK|nr:hypothetical protein [Noviherbaspirillum cavernae]RJG05504.1 hypothetical protein D3870_05255 [Noviherbaspirillum cavernae]